MRYISKDNPCYFFTSVTHLRLPVFRLEQMCLILCHALNEARISGNFSIYAYCIMVDHLHIITGGELSPSNTLRYLNGISARRIIDHLKISGHEASLNKLKVQARGSHSYSLWQHHPNTYIITSEKMMMQKVNYIHKNPVEAGSAEQMEDHRFSSARYWLRKPLLDDEPLEVDIKDLKWRG